MSSRNRAAEPGAPGPAPRTSTRMRRAAAWMATIISGFCLIYGALALVPKTSMVAFLFSVLLSSLAPFVIVVSLLAALLAWWAGRTVRRTTSSTKLVATALVLSVAAMLVPAASVWSTVRAAQRAGTDVNVFKAFAPTSMEVPADAVMSYAPGLAGRIEVYRPKNHSGPAPVLFDVHGGGWTRDARMPATLRWFADHGWLVVRPWYSLATQQRPTWDVVPQQLRDAYRWTVENAPSLGGDAKTIAVFGDSAGGGLGLNLAYDLAAHPDPKMPAPTAAVGLYPTVDVATIAGITRFEEGEAAQFFVGGTPQQYPQRYAALDTRNHVTNDAPPTLIIQGRHDTFVPPATVDSFVRTARQRGASITQVDVPLADHAFDTIAANSLGQQLVTNASERFLRQTLKHGGKQ